MENRNDERRMVEGRGLLHSSIITLHSSIDQGDRETIMEIQLKTLPPIWTGGVDGTCDRLHESGIIGSLRWWYEALIRGLGVAACDPKYSKCEGDRHCAACELFGCTGWARKFRFLVLDKNDLIAQKIESGESYTFKFIPLKPIHDEEAFLLFHTLQIISDIGSIGGKTVLKPSEVKSKNNKAHHADYGLIQLNSPYGGRAFQKNQIIEILNKFDKENNVKQSNDIPVLSNFWFIRNYYLTRIQMNTIVGRDSNGKYNNASDLQRWMGGKIGESKKIFSFHSDKAKRTWGYAKLGELDNIITLLKRNEIENIETGESLLSNLFMEVTKNGS